MKQYMLRVERFPDVVCVEVVSLECVYIVGLRQSEKSGVKRI